jgi:hypothetical protein
MRTTRAGRAGLVLLACLVLGGCAGSPVAGGGDPPAATPKLSEPPAIACTQIGCESQVTFESERLAAVLGARGALTVTACADDDCVTREIPSGRCGGLGSELSARMSCSDRKVILRLPDGGDYGQGAHTARLKVTSGGATALDQTVENLRFTRNQPNGPDCPPVCWMALAKLS